MKDHKDMNENEEQDSALQDPDARESAQADASAYQENNPEAEAASEQAENPEADESDHPEQEDKSEGGSTLEQKVKPEDLEYMSDTSAAMLLKTPKGGRILIYMMILALFSGLFWASVSELDEITRGMGKVVPSSRLQVIQNLEGGILKEMYVQEGELVEKGQPLLQLDDTRFKSTFRESAVEYYSELAKAARLKAELSGTDIKFPAELNGYQDYIQREVSIFKERSAGLRSEVEISTRQASQAKHELSASESQLEYLTTSLELGEEELSLTEPLAKQGVVSQVEMLQLKQRVNDLASERKMTELAIPKLKSAYEEALARKREFTVKFREEVVQELRETEVKLDQMTESHANMEDQVNRTMVRSPVEGIVKRININTVGGVIQPGMDLMEIVPVEDTLLIEADISPKDIGFLREGMPAVVKLTAYDFAIYGGMKGTLEHIGADTVENEKGESFYTVRVRTERSHLGTADNKLEIIPGMKTNIDIITGKKTLMDYLLKPILKSKRNALTER